jgi:Asp-tRNA(Asn)/Glu-tRNA(Gln) amidotransferase A subunit family amidase
MARTVTDAAILLDAIAGYDSNDPVTAYSVGQVPPTYTAFLDKDGLKGARLGVIREPFDPKTDTTSEEYKKVKAVLDRGLVDLKRLGADRYRGEESSKKRSSTTTSSKRSKPSTLT